MSGSDQTTTNPPNTSSAAPSPCSACGKRGETSPLAPPVSASKKQKIDDNSMTIEIDKFLECSICLDFPASPIHSCDNGHILCAQCAPKFSACPTCKLPKLSPSPVAEKLANGANKKIECGNFEAGCKEGVLSTKFAYHLASCYFRDINCDYDLNCGVKVKFHEYIKHLEEVHNIENLFLPHIRGNYFYDEELHVKSGNVFSKWPNTLIKFASHDFFFHAQVSKQSQLFFAWVSVLGDRDLADKYSCEVKFNSKVSEKFGSKWSLPVVPFHEISSNGSEAELFECSGGSAVAAVPMAALRKWGSLDLNQVLFFSMSYEIKDC